MKFNKILTAFFLLLTLNGIAQQTAQDSLTDYYQKYPQQALKDAGSMYQKAVKEHNSPLLIKALILKSAFSIRINSDDYTKILPELEKYIQEEKDPVAKSILHSYIAQLYYQYFNNNSDKISQRKELQTENPEDIAEWTTNMFREKYFGHIKASLADSIALQQTPVSAYQAIFIPGKDSKTLRPTLYDFLCQRAIAMITGSYGLNLYKNLDFPAAILGGLPDFLNVSVPDLPFNEQSNVLRILQKLLKFRSEAGNIQALVLVDLQRLKYVMTFCKVDNKDSLYMATLHKMYQSYAKNPVVVEVIAAEARLLMQDVYSRGKSEWQRNLARRENALKICEEGIRQFPQYNRINQLRQIISELKAPDLQIQFPENIYPGEDIVLKISSKNLNHLIVELYQVHANGQEYQNFLNSRDKKTLPETQILTRKYLLHPQLLFQDTVLKLKIPHSGLFKIMIKAPDAKQNLSKMIISSSLYVNSQAGKNEQTFRVCDWNSGKPIEKAKILVYDIRYPNYRLTDSLYTDSNGMAIVKLKENQHPAFEVINTKNPIGNMVGLVRLYERSKEQIFSPIFTDRKIYRPGQIIYYKGIAYKSTPDTLFAINQKPFKVTFYDNSNKELASQNVTTNRFGSFTGQFVIPAQCLNGRYYIRTSDGVTTVQIAEYKRPEFEITFTEPQKNFHTGDTITIKGKINSFSGVQMSNNSFEYQIIPYTYQWFQGGEELIQGVSSTNAEGEFELTFKAQGFQDYYNPWQRFYFYRILVKATDSKGETQENSISIPIFPNQAVPMLQLPLQINKEKKINFSILFEDIALDAKPETVYYSIVRLASPKQIQKELAITDTIPEEVVLKGELRMTQRDSIQPDLSQLPSGAYLFSVSRLGSKANKIFYLYSPSDKKPPIPTYEWIVQEKTSCLPGETAIIQFGTSAKDAYIMYEIATVNKVIERHFLTLSDQIHTLQIPYKAEYGEQIWVSINFIKDQRDFSQTIPITRLRNNRNLRIETVVFRDKLTPGQTEQWKFRIVDQAGKPVTAEVLAMMYDASLENLQPYIFRFHPTYLPGDFRFQWRTDYRFTNQYWWSAAFINRHKYTVPPLRFDQLQTYEKTYTKAITELADFGEYEEADTGEAGPPVFLLKGYSPVAVTGMARKQNSVADLTEETAQGNGANSGVSFRQNFNETAFFYPQLLTDSLGYVNIDFTIPDAMTRWKFIALATTPEMAAGMISLETVTSKPLMVRPNLPRFFRNGDQTELKVIISNLSDSRQTGKAHLELFNPDNNKVLYNQAIDFSIAARQNQTVSFSFKVPENMDAIGCKISAGNGNFSDGEQHLIAVLPTEVLLTTTLPIFSSQAGTQTYSLKQSGQEEKDYRLTLELTANPIWYAVLALPGLSEPTNLNTTDVAASYYVNALASRIVRSNPQIAEAIRNWKKDPSNTTLLQSQLQKNSELKSILLSASPWAVQAQTETEQMQSLAQLFDENRLAYLQDQNLKKLRELQDYSGGWSWFKGMGSSRFMTLNVLNILAKANLVGAQDLGATEKKMQAQALKYLDEEIISDYKQRPKQISNDQVLYLYVRSLYRDFPLAKALDAHKYFMNLARQQWSGFSFYEKARIAITMYNYGFQPEAQEVLESLRQYAVSSTEMGMYWPNNRNGYYRNSAVLVHTAIMEAFYEIKGNSPDINSMKQWLLRQKQTQSWGSVPSTVDAINALVSTGNDLLKQQETLHVQMGKYKFSTPGDNTLGYLKKSFSAGEIKPAMKTVKITKQTDTPSWGGLYLQYFEKLDQVQKQQAGISVDKKLYVEKNGELLPTRQQALKTGDKVVIRLTLSLDRDMEFLHLQDLRAACFEPIQQISGNRWKFGTVYYEDIKDAVTNFFFTALAKGTYVIEYPVWVNQAGEYQDGIATFQSIYAPEFSAYSTAQSIKVED